MSSNHALISFDEDRGWYIEDRNSTNGTFVYMKSETQMAENHISDMVEVHDEMVISFVNYEVKMRLEKRVISFAEQLC